jgi:hypothetical protein
LGSHQGYIGGSDLPISDAREKISRHYTRRDLPGPGLDL